MQRSAPVADVAATADRIGIVRTYKFMSFPDALADFGNNVSVTMMMLAKAEVVEFHFDDDTRYFCFRVLTAVA